MSKTHTGKYHVRVVVSGETLGWGVPGATVEDFEKLLKESCDKALSSIFEGNPVSIESLRISEIPGAEDTVARQKDGRYEISVAFAPDSVDDFYASHYEFARKQIEVSMDNLLAKMRSDGETLGGFVYTITARPKTEVELGPQLARFEVEDRVRALGHVSKKFRWAGGVVVSRHVDLHKGWRYGVRLYAPLDGCITLWDEADLEREKGVAKEMS